MERQRIKVHEFAYPSTALRSAQRPVAFIRPDLHSEPLPQCTPDALPDADNRRAGRQGCAGENDGGDRADERHSWRVVDKAEADARAEVIYAKYPNLREFRNGHPCWRKITDPPLFAKDGEEMVILDPDVYFPSKFCFEPTPSTGLILMWQAANCLYPHDRVRRAFDLGIAMADNTDIGVCQATSPLDYEWLDDLIFRLGGKDLPSWSAHVEPIVWAALGMRVGGGYLDPGAWFCFNNPVSKRLRRKVFKLDPMELLRTEPIRTAKCFHAGGEPKRWLVEAEKAGILEGSTRLDQPFPIIPYKRYTRAQFDRKQLVLEGRSIPRTDGCHRRPRVNDPGSSASGPRGWHRSLGRYSAWHANSSFANPRSVYDPSTSDGPRFTDHGAIDHGTNHPGSRPLRYGSERRRISWPGNG